MADKISRLLCSCSSKFIGFHSHPLKLTRALSSSCSSRRFNDNAPSVSTLTFPHSTSPSPNGKSLCGQPHLLLGNEQNPCHLPLTKTQEELAAVPMTSLSSSLRLLTFNSNFDQLPSGFIELLNLHQNSISNPVQRLPMGIPINYRINPITYEDKNERSRKPMEDPLSISNQNTIEDAPDFLNTRIEKRAARLIVIRRIKMNKHKLKKLRKRMKHIWGKMRLRRAIRKERAYLDEKLAQIREAERFDAKEHVTKLIAKAKEKEIPRRWKGKRMPAWWIKEQIALGKITL